MSSGKRSWVPRTGCSSLTTEGSVLGGVGPRGLGRLDLRRLPLDHLHEMVDDVGILQAMVRQAVDIDLMGAVAPAGKADVGLARLAGTVDHAADDRDRERRRDM